MTTGRGRIAALAAAIVVTTVAALTTSMDGALRKLRPPPWVDLTPVRT